MFERPVLVLEAGILTGKKFLPGFKVQLSDLGDPEAIGSAGRRITNAAERACRSPCKDAVAS